MIARGVFTLPGFDARQVNTIMMQATPNQHPGESGRCPIQPDINVLLLPVKQV